MHVFALQIFYIVRSYIVTFHFQIMNLSVVLIHGPSNKMRDQFQPIKSSKLILY